MKTLMRLLKFVAEEALEILVSLVLMGSLLWSLYDGNGVTWSIFGVTLVGLVVCILRPKKDHA